MEDVLGKVPSFGVRAFSGKGDLGSMKLWGLWRGCVLVGMGWSKTGFEESRDLGESSDRDEEGPAEPYFADSERLTPSFYSSGS